jgi:hypothetical protein
VERKIHFFAMDLPHSDAGFVQAYPAETTEAFCAAHVAAFAFFGGVPASILYDNTKLAVARILGDGTRQRTRVFSELQSHYLFADRFGRPGKGNDKGKVEGLVGLIRRNYLVPIPHAASFAALNEQLLADCRRRLGDRLRGHDATIGARLAHDQACFNDLPPTPYDACDKMPGRVSSLSLVRYRGTDYSVPTAYGHREVLIRGYVDSVVISCGVEIIARHVRSYEREDFVFDPLHYLALLERKIGALDQAAPLAGWDLPEVFTTLRRLLEARMGKQGKREFVHSHAPPDRSSRQGPALARRRRRTDRLTGALCRLAGGAADQPARQRAGRRAAGRLRPRSHRARGDRPTARIRQGLTIPAPAPRRLAPTGQNETLGGAIAPKREQAPRGAIWRSSLMYLYSGAPMHFPSGVDSRRTKRAA